MNLTPVTREEMFLAKAGGRDITPPLPVTRTEMFLSQLITSVEDGGNYKIETMTKAEYDSIATPDVDTIYFIMEG